LIQSSVNSFGPTIVAANTAAANLESYIYVIQNALYHTAMTFVAQNMGAGQYKRMKKSILYCVFVVSVVGLTVGSIMYLFGDLLLGVYAPGNPEVIMYGGVRFFIFCFTYFLCGIMEVGSGTLRGLGKSFISMIVSLIGSCLLRVVWIFTVFNNLPKEGTVENTIFRLNMLYISYPVTWVITSTALFIMCAFALREYKRLHRSEIRDLP